MGLCVAALITAGALLGAAVSNTRSYTSGSVTAFNIGFGAVDSRALLNTGLPQGGAGGLVAAVLLANLPQVRLQIVHSYSSVCDTQLTSVRTIGHRQLLVSHLQWALYLDAARARILEVWDAGSKEAIARDHASWPTA
jgi:hypothetical protein